MIAKQAWLLSYRLAAAAAPIVWLWLLGCCLGLQWMASSTTCGLAWTVIGVTVQSGHPEALLATKHWLVGCCLLEWLGSQLNMSFCVCSNRWLWQWQVYWSRVSVLATTLDQNSFCQRAGPACGFYECCLSLKTFGWLQVLVGMVSWEPIILLGLLAFANREMQWNFHIDIMTDVQTWVNLVYCKLQLTDVLGYC